MRRSQRLLFVLTALAAMLALPTAAWAYAPTGDDFITCVAGGDDTIECVAGVFEENRDCTFSVSTGATGSGSADAEGELAFAFDVPTGEATDIVVTVQCGTKVLAATVANVDAEGEVIANAGTDGLTLLAIGAGALALGGGILAISRRRTSSNA